MRELRHDFRRYYGCSYDSVEPGEAVDLVLTLPRGSLYRSSLSPYGEWDDARESAADVVDAIYALIAYQARGTTKDAPKLTRPSDMEARDAAAKRSREVRRRIAETKWEEVGDGRRS